ARSPPRRPHVLPPRPPPGPLLPSPPPPPSLPPSPSPAVASTPPPSVTTDEPLARFSPRPTHVRHDRRAPGSLSPRPHPRPSRPTSPWIVFRLDPPTSVTTDEPLARCRLDPTHVRHDRRVPP